MKAKIWKIYPKLVIPLRVSLYSEHSLYKKTLKGPFTQMCINIHEWTTLSRKITRFCGTMGKQELFGVENWWQETIIILIYEKQYENIFRTFWKYFFGLDILPELKFWRISEKSRNIEEFWGGLAAWKTKPQKTRFWAQVSRNLFPELHIRSAEGTNVLYDASKDEVHTTSGTLSSVHRKVAAPEPNPAPAAAIYHSV